MASEVARFRQQQELQEEAAQRALYGFAVVASHETINARMEQETPRLLHLLKEGKVDQVNEAIDSMRCELRGEEGAISVDRTTITQ